MELTFERVECIKWLLDNDSSGLIFFVTFIIMPFCTIAILGLLTLFIKKELWEGRIASNFVSMVFSSVFINIFPMLYCYFMKASGLKMILVWITCSIIISTYILFYGLRISNYLNNRNDKLF